MNRHTLVAALIWAVLTAVGETLVITLDSLPLGAAEEATIVDDAFRTLLILSAPVFAFVVAMLVYSISRFRSRGEPSRDGPPIHTHRAVIAGWFVVTTGLTVFMIIHPGITGLDELSALDAEPVDLVVQVEAVRFAWLLNYPEQNVRSFKELVLPVDKHVRFDITAPGKGNVLHSFWIPAFRIKIDAVPGLVTTEYATPNKTGTFEGDSNFRLQCTELCGVGHTTMTIPVRVVEQNEFDAWVAQQ